jgi:hypothetical protein
VKDTVGTEVVEYDSVEAHFASRFNGFYVTYQETLSVDYDWFVNMVINDIGCVDAVNPDWVWGDSELVCTDLGDESCPLYNDCEFTGESSTCPDGDIVDDDTSDGRDDPNAYCVCTCGADGICYTPYDTCRVEVVTWVVSFLEPFADYMATVAGVELFMIMLTCLLICYNPRDDINEMLRKAGTVQYVEARNLHGVGKETRPQPQPGMV